MVMTGLVRGERQTLAQWFGFVLALVGLAALLAPGVSASPVMGAFLMLVAGVAWGAYSLLGRGVVDPLGATAGNFLRTLPMAVALCVVVVIFSAKLSVSGLIYAALSGRSVGARLYYLVRGYSGPDTQQGASVQLSVPVITALGGALVLGEGITVRLTASSLAILSGIGLVIASRRNV
jgi:EamA-like transporter family.